MRIAIVTLVVLSLIPLSMAKIMCGSMDSMEQIIKNNKETMKQIEKTHETLDRIIDEKEDITT